MPRHPLARSFLVAWISGYGCAVNPDFYAVDTGADSSGQDSSGMDSGVGPTDCVEPTLALDFEEGAADSRFTFYRDTAATYVNEQGRIQAIMAGRPRFEHACGPTCDPAGLLVEPGSTNEAASDLSVWTPTAAMLVESSETAPDGTTSVVDLVDDAQDLEHMIEFAPDVWADGEYWTFSAFAKAGTLTELRLFNASGQSYSIAHFSVLDGTLTSTNGGQGEFDTFVDAGSQAWPDGWWRLWLTFHPPIGTKLILRLAPFKGGQWIYVGTGQSLSLWGPQLERGVVPTSFIPTLDAPPAVRGEDIAFLSSLDWLDPKRGTFVIEFSRVLAPMGDEWVFQLGDQTGASWIGVRASAADKFAVTVQSGGVQQGMVEFPFTVSQRHRVAMSYGESSWATAVDGGPVESRSAIVMPSAFTKLDLGGSTPASTKLHGHIATVHYYDCRRSDEQLRMLSAP